MLGLIPTLFFIGFYAFFNFKIASLAMAVGSVIQLCLAKLLKVKIKGMDVVNLIISLVLVLFIFLFDKPEVFMFKPSIFGLLICLSFFISHIFNLNFSKKLFAGQFKFKPSKREDLVWSLYGALILTSNEIARRVFEESQWVVFKLTFFPILTLAFTSIFIIKFINFKKYE